MAQLSENGLATITVLRGDAPHERGYHNNKSGLLTSSETIVEKLKKRLPKRKRKSSRGGRPRASDRAIVNAIWYVLWTDASGRPSIAIGTGSPQASSMNASGGGGAWASSRS
jgi:hypothetical protein